MKRVGNTILVTGAGSGIGRELARRLQALGNTVVAAGRRLDALEETIDGRERMHAAPLDVADPAQVAAFARRVTAEHPALNVLINNAGVMRYEQLAGARDLRDAEAMVATNLLGPLRLVDALIEHLVARPDAAIINVTSGLAFVPLVAAATYSATKAALHSYTVSLREQLRGRVEVIELAPPAVQTELTPGQSTREGYLPLGAYMEETMSLLLQEPTPPEVLVERVKLLRFAEREGRFDATLAALNGPRA